MFKRENQLDEMQELKLLKIEHNGFWLAFWGLLVAMAVQILLIGQEFRYIAGEWIMFMALCLYVGIATAQAGIYDRHIQIGWKSSLLLSLLAGFVFFLFQFSFTYSRYGMLSGSLAGAAISGVIVIVACFIGLMLTGRYVKKRQESLEAEEEEEDL
ncbi:MAG: hypothetical protein IJ179_05120 [Oscillospiraceae bacterium]|nr:hypothetical protein [Oscillospiraceae bacterium]